MPSAILKRSIQVLSILPLFALGACGEGWDMQPYHGTPYGERTAGHGVEYVRAKMMPEKGPVLEDAMEKAEPLKEEDMAEPETMPEEAAEESAPEPEIKDAAPVFNQKMKK